MGQIIIDGERIPISPSCWNCINLLDSRIYKCKAFDKIPIVIWIGDNKHRKPFPNDNGIQFEKET